MMLNVRGGFWFVERPYEGQRAAFQGWLRKAIGGRLLVIEIGAGFNTPSVIRWPCEAITVRHHGAHLIRINPQHPKPQFQVGERATVVAMPASLVLSAVATRR